MTTLKTVSHESINNKIGSIYIHKNDPKVVNKGINITDVKQAQGGYLPLLADDSYKERKFDNQIYSYNTKTHHGTRPMHRSTYNFAYQNDKHSFLTNNRIDYQGFRLRPEYLPFSTKNQFDHHFDIGTNEQIDLTTHYGTQFYKKNDSKEYISNFDVMPKYSVGKQVYQLKKDNVIKEYNNRKSRIKEAIEPNEHESNYWTQYKRTHDYLGLLRGNGVSKNYPERETYNILTGEKLKRTDWSIGNNYKKKSGDVSNNLNDARQKKFNLD